MNSCVTAPETAENNKDSIFMPTKSANNATAVWHFADCETHFGHLFGICSKQVFGILVKKKKMLL